MIGRILRALDNAFDKGDASEASHRPPAQGNSNLAAPAPDIMPVSARSRTPIFTILAGIFFVVCLTSPIILLTMPMMLTLGMVVVAIVRKERPRWLAPTVGVLSLFVMFAASARLDDIGDNLRGDSPSTIAEAKLTDWNWQPDPEFGSRGTIKWNASVQNTSDRPMSLVKVELTTYDRNGRIVSSDFTYINAIAPGATRTEESYADYYGTEDRAEAKVVEASYSNN